MIANVFAHFLFVFFFGEKQVTEDIYGSVEEWEGREGGWLKIENE